MLPRHLRDVRDDVEDAGEEVAVRCRAPPEEGGVPRPHVLALGAVVSRARLVADAQPEAVHHAVPVVDDQLALGVEAHQ